MGKSILISLSGGMDSTTLIAWALDNFYTNINVISFIYGSKHNSYENESVLKIVEYYRNIGVLIKVDFIDISKVFTGISSSLLKTGGEIPEGHYAQDSMKSTVVPSRNLIMASILAARAESNKIETIALGIHSGDHHIYPDCRPEFIASLKETIHHSSDGVVKVISPFLHLDKAKILNIGYSSGIYSTPYHLTRTCYKDSLISCGKCGSCIERLEAFKIIGKPDPISYL